MDNEFIEEIEQRKQFFGGQDTKAVIGDDIIIIMGHDKGKICKFKGLKNNSNWRVLDFHGQEILVNEEEFQIIPQAKPVIEQPVEDEEEALIIASETPVSEILIDADMPKIKARKSRKIS